MHENSLFAILIRSPWWLSIGIGAAIIGIEQAVFGGKYAFFSVFAAFPFVIIATVSVYRQAKTPGAQQLEEVEAWARSVGARKVAAALMAAYRESGYEVTPLNGKAADFQLEKSGRTQLVCCKRIKAASSGPEPLRSLAAAGANRETSGTLYFTLGELSAEARKFADAERIEILGLQELVGLVGKRVRSGKLD